MDRYYVFADRRRKRARLHRGSCVYCDHGQRRHDAFPHADTASWSAGFSSLKGAEIFLREEFADFSDVVLCGICRPDLPDHRPVDHPVDRQETLPDRRS